MLNLLEEFFDLDWYKFIGIDELGANQIEIWEAGFEKLRRRYPDKFSSENAINRDIESEQKVFDFIDTSNST